MMTQLTAAEASALELKRWTRAVQPMENSGKDFSDFLQWCAFHGVKMPADTYEVGNYLIELMADGSSMEEIERIAASIWSGYQRRQAFLDVRLLERALETCKAQLHPNRVLN
jgi:hypothetical protein